MPTGYRVEKWQELFAPNPAMLRHSLTIEGYHVFQWSDEPGTEYGSHMHGEDQSHWIITGSLELSVQGVGVFVLEPATVILCRRAHTTRPGSLEKNG